jgi:hypothetical protein
VATSGLDDDGDVELAGPVRTYFTVRLPARRSQGAAA